MKKYIFFVFGFLSLIQAVDNNAINTLNAHIVAIQKDLDTMKATGAATVEEMDAMTAKITTLTNDMNTVKANAAQEIAARAAVHNLTKRPQTLYHHCICTHYETGGTLRMHNYNKSCHVSGGYMSSSACRAKSKTDSPDLQLICNLVATDSPTPPTTHSCDFFTS